MASKNNYIQQREELCKNRKCASMSTHVVEVMCSDIGNIKDRVCKDHKNEAVHFYRTNNCCTVTSHRPID